MSEAYVVDREFLFKTSIYEITSISIEHNYDINGSNCEGEFIISGDYRLHEISINKEDFSFKIPFTHEIKSNINLDSVEIEITDFKYDLVNDDELKVHVEYVVSGEQGVIEFADEKSLDEFLSNNEAEIVDLKEETKEEENKVSTETKEESRELPKVDLEVTKEKEVIPKKEEKSIDEKTIIDSINSEEKYVKYHIHIVTMDDTIEAILSKYKITLNDLKKYNTFENLELNMKLIIPEYEEN
jgi:LysM repeat protein